jgi:hypothetical protein
VGFGPVASSSHGATFGFDDGPALALVVVLVVFDPDADVLGSGGFVCQMPLCMP